LEVRPSAGGGARIRIQAKKVLEDVRMGDSIAVNGTCLTAVAWGDDWVEFDAVAETLRRTTLTGLDSRTPVNLERALAVGSRVGGHYVTGHIDGSGRFESRLKEGNGVVYKFSADPELMVLVAAKGSIAVDGISLTVVDVSDEAFTVWIVPHTESATNLSTLKPGDSVNLETDILAKYVARMVCRTGEGGSVTMNKLQEAGFLS
jgi:riboflavin synthase